MSNTAVSAADVKLSDIGDLRRAGDQGESPVIDGRSADVSEPTEAVKNFRVALVNMPFKCSFRPSVQIGLQTVRIGPKDTRAGLRRAHLRISR